jgi:predicted nucleic acid binding AN1-type Zn finger protein
MKNDKFYDDDYDNNGDDSEDMTGFCEDAPHACNHCSNYGCNAHPSN